MAISAPSTRAAVWAESGQTTTPSQGEQQSGFVTGKPPRRKTNWLMNWLDNAVQWILQVGVPEYDAARAYYPGARVVFGDGKYGWMRIGEGATTGVAPDSDNTKWIRWGHTTEELDGAIDDKLGTLSGALAEGTISASNNGVVSYQRQLCFPNSTDKIVCARVELHKDQSGNWATTLTLSGAAAFTNGATGAVVGLQNKGSGNDGYPAMPLAIIVSETQVTVSFNNGCGVTGSDPMVVEVQIRGN